MAYILVYMQKSQVVEKRFPTIFDAIKESIRILEETQFKLKGIKCDDDLIEPQYVLRTAAINCIWFTLANCPDGYWREGT